ENIVESDAHNLIACSRIDGEVTDNDPRGWSEEPAMEEGGVGRSVSRQIDVEIFEPPSPAIPKHRLNAGARGPADACFGPVRHVGSPVGFDRQEIAFYSSVGETAGAVDQPARRHEVTDAPTYRAEPLQFLTERRSDCSRTGR